LRCLIATSLPHEQVISWLNLLIAPHATVNAGDRYMPGGLLSPDEAKLGDAVGFLLGTHRAQLTKWWLAVPERANTPNWDLVSTCTVGDQPGLVLVEAKAHRAELHEGGKPAGNPQNDERIRLAIDEAATQLGRDDGWNLSARRNYQLSNRFAWAWKLASLGVPVVLVYLGFLDADEMPAPLKSADHWQRCVLDHAEGIVPQGAWEQPIPVGSASIIPLIRSARVSASVERAVLEESHRPEPHDGPVAILCADWGKEPGKRAVYIADVATRSVRRISSRGWTVSDVLAEAQQNESRGSVLVTFDAPLGVPASYLAALANIPASGAPKNFLAFMELACAKPEFFEATSVANQWEVERPFFNVPPGRDGLGAYLRSADDRGVDLYRAIDRQTRAKSVFVKSGIPGSVGSAACALWSQLGALMTTDRQFRVWPFEGDLESLLKTAPVVIGEIYPRAAYSTALLDDLGTGRPPLVLAKTDGAVRRSAIDALQKASWVQRFGVTLGDLAQAEDNEDDFDACITAAALLRCILEGLPLSAALNDASQAEGGILGTGSVDLQLRERAWSGSLPKPPSTRAAPDSDVAIGEGPARLSGGHLPHIVASSAPERRIYQCPIPGCAKTFVDSRGGWDAHVGSIRQHPGWHPALLLPRDRRRQFEQEFPSFFL